MARAGAARALDPAAVAAAVGAGRWVLLAAVLAQLAAACVAACLRRARGFEAFREPPGADLEARFRAHEAKLARLRECAAPSSAQGKPAGRAAALAAVSGSAAAAPPPPRDRIRAGRGAAPAAAPLRPRRRRRCNRRRSAGGPPTSRPGREPFPPSLAPPLYSPLSSPPLSPTS